MQSNAVWIHYEKWTTIAGDLPKNIKPNAQVKATYIKKLKVEDKIVQKVLDKSHR